MTTDTGPSRLQTPEKASAAKAAAGRAEAALGALRRQVDELEGELDPVIRGHIMARTLAIEQRRQEEAKGGTP